MNMNQYSLNMYIANVQLMYDHCICPLMNNTIYVYCMCTLEQCKLYTSVQANCMCNPAYVHCIYISNMCTGFAP